MQPLPAPDDEPQREPRAASGRNLPVAILTGVGLASVLIATILWAIWPYAILVSAALLVALAELYRTIEKAQGLTPAGPVGYAGLLIVILGTAWRGPVAIGFGLVVASIVAFLWYLVDPERSRVTENLSATIFGLVYVAVFGAHAVAMARLENGHALTIVFFGGVVFYDIGAYAFGSFFGKHKLAPSISPAKSWEGALGATGVVFAAGVGIAPLFNGVDIRTGLALALIVALLAPMGDLAESLIKRDLGVKDMGGLLPGHGGVLDRVDALLLAAPVAYWFFRAFAQ